MSRLRPGRFYTQRDANEKPIVAALRAQGFHVDHLNGAGVPDLLVSKAGRVWLIEIKSLKGTFKPAQIAWREAYQGPQPIVLRSVDDALRFMLLACEQATQEAGQ